MSALRFFYFAARKVSDECLEVSSSESGLAAALSAGDGSMAARYGVAAQVVHGEPEVLPDGAAAVAALLCAVAVRVVHGEPEALPGAAAAVAALLCAVAARAVRGEPEVLPDAAAPVSDTVRALRVLYAHPPVAAEALIVLAD